MRSRFAELITLNSSDKVALRGVRVRSRLGGFSQKTIVEQTFINLEDRAIEAVYTFPLPENAAVCGFEVVTGDRVLTGTIDETEQAQEKYDRAIDSGDAAFILEQQRPDVFTLRVGNINPRQAATIKITYICPLEVVDRQVRVTYPTTIAPRYTSSAGTDPLNAAIDGDALNPPHAISVPYGLTLDVELALGAKRIKAITSPSHTIDPRRDEDGSTRVSIGGGGQGPVPMDREVVLLLELNSDPEPHVELAPGRPGSNESFLAVTFVPEFDVVDLVGRAPEPCETVFVLDCSGSMQGESIAQAMKALSLCLRSLSAGDTFNVCRFGSTYEMLSREPLTYGQSTLESALAFIARGANLGGTELMAPLGVILQAMPARGKVRQVVLLTDGQVTNEPAILALARRHRGHNRLFTFGIGPACSQFLVKGLARATGGAAEFVAYGERIEDKVLRTFARLNSPVVDEVHIDWHDAEVQTLAELPPVFDGDVLTVFGRAEGTAPRRVTLRCRLDGKPREWPVVVGPPAEDPNRLIATMWARRTIQSLEEVNDVRTQASARSGAVDARERGLLIRLSKEFNLLCTLTSFVAVEHRTFEERNEGRPELRRVPQRLASGCGGSDPFDWRRRAFVMYSCSPAASARDGVSGLLAAAGGRVRGSMSLESLSRRDDRIHSDGARARLTEEYDALHDLLNRQTADGFFELSAVYRTTLLGDLKSAIGGGDPGLRKLVATPPIKAESDRERVHDTCLVLALLRRSYAQRRAEWRRAEAKAIRWLLDRTGWHTEALELLLAQIPHPAAAS